MKGCEPFRLRATDCFDLGESVKHSQVDVVRVRLRDLPHPLVVIGDISANLETLEGDRRPDTSGI
jgi:hypothetical protein